MKICHKQVRKKKVTAIQLGPLEGTLHHQSSPWLLCSDTAKEKTPQKKRDAKDSYIDS